MSEQPTIFDAIASRQAAETGITLAADHNARLIIQARELAVAIAKRKGTVTADDVMLAWVNQGGGVHDFGNSFGGLFRDRRFEWTGRRIKSTRIHAHANEIKVWKLK